MISINTNTGSLYAQQALSLNNRGYTTAMQQLSTGKQINSASDNIAGSAISVGLSAQIRALNQAVRNANDGISILSTADTGLDQVAIMLQRMRDLSVQSVSDTTSSQDRNMLNSEFQNLKSQITAISANTQWNGINILDGKIGSDWEGNFSFQVGPRADQTIRVQVLNLEQAPPIYVTGGNNQTKTFAFNSGVTPSGWQAGTDDPFPSQAAAYGMDGTNIPNGFGSIYGSLISVSVNGVQAASARIGSNEISAIGSYPGTGFYFDPTTTPSNGKIQPPGTELSTTMMGLLKADFKTKNGAKIVDGDHFVANIVGHSLTVGYANRDQGTNSTIADDNFTVSFEGVSGWAQAQIPSEQRFDLSVWDVGNETSEKAQDQLKRVVTAHFGVGANSIDLSHEVTQTDIDNISKNGSIKLSEAVANDFAAQLNASSLFTSTMGLRANSSEKGVLSVDFQTPSFSVIDANVTVQGFLPLSTADLKTGVNASHALSNVDSALEVLSLQRAKIGVAVSSLEANSTNLSLMSTKAQEARSQIEDTSYSQATTDLAKRTIIKQAAQAMLAQANSTPQAVLLLLKSH